MAEFTRLITVEAHTLSVEKKTFHVNEEELPWEQSPFSLTDDGKILYLSHPPELAHFHNGNLTVELR